MPDSRDAALQAFQERLAACLGRPVLSAAIAERAAADPLFLHQLLSKRDDPQQLEALMRKGDGAWPKWAVPASLQAFARLGHAITRWATSGFDMVDEQTFRARIAVCRQCPHLASPGRPLEKLIAGRNGAVCGLCSCAVEKKAALPTEFCPAADPARPRYNRWGDPFIP